MATMFLINEEIYRTTYYHDPNSVLIIHSDLNGLLKGNDLLFLKIF